MPTNKYPIVNGIAPSWADITIKLSPYGGKLLEMDDIAAVNTGRSLEEGEQRAPGGHVKRRTTGAPSYTSGLTLYRDGFQDMLDILRVVAPLRGNQRLISLVFFDINILHTPPNSTKIFHRIVRGARVMGDTMNAAEGTDAQQVEVPLSTIQIVDIVNGEEVLLV